MPRKMTTAEARRIARLRENPGRKPKPAYCERCGARCESVTAARQHCR